MNVFIGENDAGKSNILKSLNLFFNNETDIDQSFDFDQDLSRLRDEQARAAKGRATIWIKVTFNNFLNWRSLPPRFSVKRTWNRYSPLPSDTYPNRVSSTTIGRFLNKLSYHYIPAVRGREIFSHYLEQLHDSLMEDEKAGVRLSAEQLLETINSSTEDMAERILEGLGFESKIQVPENLKDLFYALDFATKFGTHDIPLQMRGDGIQARHIPFILDFIARHSTKHHIWGYEEPENSLELRRAYQLGEQFSNDFSEQNQIFITTHSPAFYDLEGNDVSRWFVQSENADFADEPITTVNEISATHIADARLGMAAVLSKRGKEIYKENSLLKESLSQLSATISERAAPQVIVEGPSDQIILEAAFAAHRGEGPINYNFVSAGGVNNIEAFIKTAANLNNPFQSPLCAVVDNDDAGRKVARSFSRYKYFEETKLKEIDSQKRIYFGTLPTPQELREPLAAIQEHVAVGTLEPISVEYMFPPGVIAQATDAGVLNLNDRYTTARDGELALRVNLTQNYRAYVDDEYLYLIQSIDEASKLPFAHWIRGQNPQVFQNFALLFEELDQIFPPN